MILIVVFSNVCLADRMPIENFLQHCTTEYRSNCSGHRKRGAMHRKSQDYRWSVEIGKQLNSIFNNFRKFHHFFFSSWKFSNRLQSRVLSTTTIHTISMTCTQTSMVALEADCQVRTWELVAKEDSTAALVEIVLPRKMRTTEKETVLAQVALVTLLIHGRTMEVIRTIKLEVISEDPSPIPATSWATTPMEMEAALKWKTNHRHKSPFQKMWEVYWPV